jgi:hypothetical protein
LAIGEEVKVTSEKCDGSEPVWEDEFHFHVANKDNTTIVVTLQSDAGGKYAQAKVPVGLLPVDPSADAQVDLEPPANGTLRLSFGLALVSELAQECD